MNYTYKIDEIFEEGTKIRVTYSSVGVATKSVTLAVPSSFSSSDISSLIEDNAPIQGWKDAELSPDLSGVSVGALNSATHTEPSVEPEDSVILPIKTIDEAKAESRAEIDARATSARDRYRSPNKDATYLNKSAELDRYITAGRPDPVIESEYPYLYNEALETEMTVTAVANLIETTRALWVPALDPVIEGKCRGGKVKVDAATTFEEVEVVRDAAITALNAI